MIPDFIDKNPIHKAIPEMGLPFARQNGVTVNGGELGDSDPAPFLKLPFIRRHLAASWSLSTDLVTPIALVFLLDSFGGADLGWA